MVLFFHLYRFPFFYHFYWGIRTEYVATCNLQGLWPQTVRLANLQQPLIAYDGTPS